MTKQLPTLLINVQYTRYLRLSPAKINILSVAIFRPYPEGDCPGRKPPGDTFTGFSISV
jgi:hypothetical protein